MKAKPVKVTQRLFVVIIKEMDYGGEYINKEVHGPFRGEWIADKVGTAMLKTLRNRHKNSGRVFDFESIELCQLKWELTPND